MPGHTRNAQAYISTHSPQNIKSRASLGELPHPSSPLYSGWLSPDALLWWGCRSPHMPPNVPSRRFQKKTILTYIEFGHKKRYVCIDTSILTYTYTTTLRVTRRLGDGRESFAAVTRVIRNSLVHSAPVLLQFAFASPFSIENSVLAGWTARETKRWRLHFLGTNRETLRVNKS